MKKTDGIAKRTGSRKGWAGSRKGPDRERVDPLAFGPDADEVDIARSARGHMAFGFGTHQCLGQNLARVEMQVAWPRLFACVPGLRLAVDVDALPFKTNSIVYGLESLPVTW